MLFHGSKYTKVPLEPFGVVVLNKILNHVDQARSIGEAYSVIPLSLQDAPESFHRSVINTLGNSGHALGHYINEIDEVWFFYDVELKDISLWEERYRIIKELRKLRRKPGIKVRLLLTTGCIEYWLMLHYQFFIPPLGTVSDKEKVMAMLVGKELTYQKGELKATAKIAKNYPTAVENAKKTLSRLLDEGMPGLEESDIRNQWLSQHCKTFSTVFEALEFLLCL